MERKVTKKKLTALLTVFVIIANLFAPYSVLAADRLNDLPYIEASLQQVQEVDPTVQNPRPTDWNQATKNYYYDYINRKKDSGAPYPWITTVGDSKVHLITVDFTIKNVAKNPNALTMALKFDTSILTPAYPGTITIEDEETWESIDYKVIKTDVGTNLTKFGKVGEWDTVKTKDFNGTDTITLDMVQLGKYATEGQSVISMTFLLKDGYSINDIKPSVFSLVSKSGNPKGLKIKYFEDKVHDSTVEGIDYLEFVGFAEDDRVTVSSITVNHGLNDNTYYKNQAIDFTGMKIEIAYSDGTTKTITKDNMDAEITAGTISIADAEKYAKADNKVTIKAGEKSCEIPYLLPKELNITSDLTQMTVEHGNPIDFAGGKVTITYDDNTTTEELDIKQSITDGILTPDKTVADVDNNTVAFTYVDGKVTKNQLTLTVTDPIVGIYISTQPTQPEIEYNENETLGRTTGKINTKHKSGHSGQAEIPMSDPNVTLSQTKALIGNCTNVRTKADGSQAGDLIVNVSYRDPQGNTWTGYTDNEVNYPASYTVLVNDTISKVEVTSQPTAINKHGTSSADLNLSGAIATITTASGHTFTQNIDKGMVNFAGYSSTSLAEKEYAVTYGGIPTVAGKGLKLKLIDYVKEIIINKTQDPKTNYNEELTDAHLSTSGVTYTPKYASGALGTAVPVTKGIVQNYTKNPTKPAYTYDSVKHEFEETVKAQVALYEYEGAPATKVFFKDFTLKVVDTVKGIKVVQPPNKVLWVWGDTFDEDGMRIAREFESGETETPGLSVKNNENASVSNTDDTAVTLTPTKLDTWTDGVADKVIKVKYIDPNTNQTLSTTTTVKVQDKLESIAIKDAPKDRFYHGEAWGVGSGTLDITYKSERVVNRPLNSGTSFKFAPDNSNVNTRPTDAEYGTGTSVTKQVQVTYEENAVSKTLATPYPITITNYVDTMIMQTYPTTPKEYIIGASSYDFTNVGGTNGKDEVKVTWLNGKEEIIDLDSTRLSLTPLNTLTNEAGTKTATVTLTDGAGNNIKDKANQNITTTFDIKVGDGIVSAHITGDMTKKAYNVGDTIDLSGIKFYEKYGSTPATGEGSEGTEVTYPNSKITVKDKETGGDFKTELPYTEFNSVAHISNRTVVITFTPDSTKPALTQTKEIPITIYNQVKTVALHTPVQATYDIDEAMATTEIEVTRTATGSPADMVALAGTDFAPNFTTATPGSKSITYTYTDNGNVDGPKTFPAVTYNYSVNDSRTAVTIDGEVTEANKNYNWGETINLGDLTIYEKFASDTDSTSKGQAVAISDSRITIKDITNVSTPVDVKADLSLPTKLLKTDFNSTTHKAQRTLEITFIADPNGGTGTNNKATKTVNINVLNYLDHIEVGTTGTEKPKDSFSVNETVPDPNGSIFIFRKAEVEQDGASATSSETKPITGTMLSNLTTATATVAGSPRTATVTYEENDAHGTAISKTDTYTYDVVDTSLGATFTGTFTKNTYDWGEALDLSEIKLYEKFSSTPATGEGSKGTEISLSDASKVTIEDITDSSNTKNITGNLTKATELTNSEFSRVTGTDFNWARQRKIRISYTAGNGIVATKELLIDVYDTVDHITVNSPLGDDPKKYVIGETVTYPVGTYTVYRKSSPNASTEQYPITEALLNNTLKTDTVTTNGKATVTHEENDAKGSKQQYPATFNYTVADVVTKIEIKTPAPKPQVKFGQALKDSDLNGVFIEVYKGGTDPVGDPIQITASMISGLNINKLGDQTVTVTYGQDIDGNPVTTTMTIEVVDYVKNIIVTNPSKATYEVGDTFDPAGITLQDVMASEEGKTLTTPVITIANAMAETDPAEKAVLGDTTLSASGSKTINVTWHGFTKPVTVTVGDVVLTPVYTAPTATNTFKYENPESKGLDLTGGKIELKKKYGTADEAVVETIELTGDLTGKKVTIGTPDYTTLGTQNLDVTYDGTVVGTIPVTIEDYIKEISVTKPTDSEYEPGETINLTRRISWIRLGRRNTRRKSYIINRHKSNSKRRKPNSRIYSRNSICTSSIYWNRGDI